MVGACAQVVPMVRWRLAARAVVEPWSTTATTRRMAMRVALMPPRTSGCCAIRRQKRFNTFVSFLSLWWSLAARGVCLYLLVSVWLALAMQEENGQNSNATQRVRTLLLYPR